VGLLASIESSAAGALAGASYADVPALTTGSILFGGVSKKLILIANVLLDPPTLNDMCADFRFAVDGIVEGPEAHVLHDVGTPSDRTNSLAGFMWFRPGMIGNHTISIQWRLRSCGPTCPTLDATRVRNLQVIEVNA